MSRKQASPRACLWGTLSLGLLLLARVPSAAPPRVQAGSASAGSVAPSPPAGSRTPAVSRVEEQERLLAAASPSPLAPLASLIGTASGPVGCTPRITTGGIFAYGHEASAPYRICVDDDGILILDGNGCRFHYRHVHQTPAIDALQLATLLDRGGLVVFGEEYALAIAPPRSLELVQRLRRIKRHASRMCVTHLAGQPPLVRDLVHPIALETLAAPTPPDGD